MSGKPVEPLPSGSDAVVRALFEQELVGVGQVDPGGRIVSANARLAHMLGYAPGELHGLTFDAITHPDHRDESRRELGSLLGSGASCVIEARLLRKDGDALWALTNVTAVRDESGAISALLAFVVDISERKRTEHVTAGQAQALELMVKGAPLPEVLQALCDVIERQAIAPLCTSLLLMDDDGCHLRPAAGRHLPVSWSRAVDPWPVGPDSGACGTAAYRRETVISPDIMRDPLWAGLRELAAQHGLRACWSTPIFSSGGAVLGTFALYYPRVYQPDAGERRLVEVIARTAGVAIERHRAEATLKTLARELGEAARKQDVFIALLAHELRNPLAPLRNGLYVMRLASHDAAAVARARSIMERQLSHLVRLIDDLLDVSRISLNKLQLCRAPVTLAEIVSTAIETARPAIDGAKHELEVRLPNEPLLLDADLTRLAQVLSNLLTNAAKFTPKRGRIALGAERQGDVLTITVEDNGIGLRAESLNSIFDLFSQVDHSVERTSGGLGIGLSLVRGLTEMHGGSVRAESAGPGQGSRFVVRLPVLGLAGEDRAASVHPVSPETLRLRILVADDNRDAVESLATMLRLSGNEVHTASDGVEAVELAESLLPDVVLMDIGMPRLNGRDATRRIRAEEWGKKMIVIAVTGWGQDSDRRLSREAGCDEHLVKPIDLAELTRLLRELRDRQSRASEPGALAPPEPERELTASESS